jgi:K+-sensing histidine kinase KdpD
MKVKFGALHSSIVCYVFAIVIGVAALLAYQASVKLVGNLPTYIFFYPAVIITALLTGFGPGVLATVMSALLASYWILPPAGLAVSSLPDAVGLVIFSFSGVLISVIALLYGRARRKAADYAADLALQAERKKADETLQKSQEQFRTLADSIPNLAWWANGDGYITWYNKR